MTYKTRKKIVHNTQDAIFRRIHGNRLIYNTCWEDPHLDRQLLNLKPDSEVVMITSAGCNALDYLLDGPAKVHCVDMNLRQNALLHLKIALFRYSNHDELFTMFGTGRHYQFGGLYMMLREHLPGFAQRFWDQKIPYFDPEKKRKSFYYYGSSGDMAWLFKGFLRANRFIRDALFELTEAQTLNEQRAIYERIAPKVWNKVFNWVVKQPVTMAMVGVPRPQVQLVKTGYEDGLTGFIKERMEHLCTDIPMRDNYFWRVYLHGKYTEDCCPNYLKAENFDQLKDKMDGMHTYTSTISDFLKCHPEQYSHYVLLDHQDWLAWNDPAALSEEWQLILRNSKPGTTILMRSAGNSISFLPQFVRDHVTFHPELTEPLHPTDRVGTYGSFHMGVVK